jgi:hypothetical protein
MINRKIIELVEMFGDRFINKVSSGRIVFIPKPKPINYSFLSKKTLHYWTF